MSATVDPADLVGLTEIAKLANVARNTAGNWVSRWPDFPKPVATLAMGPIWNRPEVEAYLRTPRRIVRTMQPRITS